MSEHACVTLAPEGRCFRCDLNRDEYEMTETEVPPEETLSSPDGE